MNSYSDIKNLLNSCHPDFWLLLQKHTNECTAAEDIFTLSALRKRAMKNPIFVRPLTNAKPIRLAVIGGYSLNPLLDFLEQFLFAHGQPVEIYQGQYDNYSFELIDPGSDLVKFKPDIVVVMPAKRRHHYQGNLIDQRDDVERAARNTCKEILALIEQAHQLTGANFILSNFIPSVEDDLGVFGNKTLASDWNFTRFVNLELSLRAPVYVQICNLEYIAARMGLKATRDSRAWYESKQIGSAQFLFELAKEMSHLVSSQTRVMKKVLVLDLDNTIWGGVIGDDGLEGIELGDTSAVGEAYKDFQKYVLSLSERGVLLAVCSKNDMKNAQLPFEKHPEMVLHLDQIVSFKANWDAKADNIRLIAKELDLGLDSFVFVDDNPAEIEIVRQYLPEVSTIHLGPDPSCYIGLLKNSRYFEPQSITKEDIDRTKQYQLKAMISADQSSAVDMPSYLRSLAMVGILAPFAEIDIPRITQLINKSNQFNLTTIRRNEAMVQAIAEDKHYAAFTFRLKDKFVDHGLISIGIARIENRDLIIDTWLMSCRVLKRQVESEVFNEFLKIAQEHQCLRIVGRFYPTAKNDLVKNLYTDFGFHQHEQTQEYTEYSLPVIEARTLETMIKLERKSCDASRGY